MRTAGSRVEAPVDCPRVSIIIPVYNGANYLCEAIDSALAQTYRNIEVIVVNDGSDDSGTTERIALSYGDKIRYFSKENGGVASALNAGIRAMSGEYFSWLSHDDVYCPEKITEQVRYLRELQEPVVLYSDYEVINHRSEYIRKAAIQYYAPSEFRRALLFDNPIHGCTALIPRICFEKVGFFDERLRTTQDYDLWFRMSKEYEFVHVPVVLMKSREHLGQGTVTMNGLHMRECTTYLLNVMHEQLSHHITDDTKGLFLASCAVNFRARGFTEAAKHAFSQFQLMVRWHKLIAHPAYFLLFSRYIGHCIRHISLQMYSRLFQQRKHWI